MQKVNVLRLITSRMFGSNLLYHVIVKDVVENGVFQISVPVFYNYRMLK